MRLPFQIDPFSYALGFVSALLFAWLLSRLRPSIQEWRKVSATRRAEAQERRATGVEDNHRRATLRRAQGMHLAASLFALDEVLLEPRLLAPPPRVEPGGALVTEDIVAQTLPYMPSWPELATVYRAPSLGLGQALSGGSHLAITGRAGAGKSVALAHLASLAANRDSRLGELSEFVPFIVHAADLNLPITNPANVLNPIFETCAEYLSMFDSGRMPSFTEFVFKSGRALLLVDGYDELPSEDQQKLVEYFKALLSAHPKIRIVTTALPEHIGGLNNLGFAALTLLGWTKEQQQTFMRKWGALWDKVLGAEAWAQNGPEAIDPIILEAWLESGNQYLSPLEFTLKTWGGFAGDGLGPNVLEAIASHVRRLAPAGTPLAALETLAMQMVVNAQPVFEPRRARDWVKKYDVIEEGEIESHGEAPAEGEEEKPAAPAKKGKTTTVKAASLGLLGKLVTSGLLEEHPNQKIRFAHPIFSGYLAGRALTAYSAEDTLSKQENWSGKLLAVHYLAAQGNPSRFLEQLLATADPVLERPLLTAARWLKDAPRDAAWRGKIMAGLARVLQSEQTPRGLRAQAMAAFALCGDPGAAAFFRQAMQSLSFDLIPLASLGSGAIEDAKAIELLSSTMSAPSTMARRAACLALIAIGTTSAQEAVARALLNGDDDLRRAAAEALANDPKEGYEMLRDGAGLADIMVRRAVVYGLGRVTAPWAKELLQTIQVEDNQWIVRNAAGEVLDSGANPADPRIPRRLPPPSQSPWLIEFAGKQGVGIPPGSSGADILLTALKSGTEEERLAALTYLRRIPTEGVVKAIYQTMQSDDAELRDTCFQVLFELGASGMSLPSPAKFGVN